MATYRQKLAAQKIVDNRGNLSKTMLEVGYSPSTAKNPSNLANSKGWKELMDEHFPQSKVAQRHGELLDASMLEHYIFPSSEDDNVIKEIIESIAGCRLMQIRKQQNWKRAYYWTPDNKSRKDAIDMAYKLRGNYASEKVKFEDPLSGLTAAELLERRKLVEAKLKETRDDL